MLLLSCLNGSVPHANRNACEVEALEIILPDSGIIRFPNVYTPDADGFNDGFIMQQFLDTALFENFHLIVSWGFRTAFESTDPNFFWSGEWDNGSPTLLGTYEFEVYFEYDNVSFAEVGEVSLLAPRKSGEEITYNIDCSTCLFPDQIFENGGSIQPSNQPTQGLCE